MNPIAERRIAYQDGARQGELTVQIWPPEPREGAWACKVVVSEPFALSSEALGDDAMQALYLGMVKAGLDLRFPPPHLRHLRLTDEWGADFGFPPPPPAEESAAAEEDAAA